MSGVRISVQQIALNYDPALVEPCRRSDLTLRIRSGDIVLTSTVKVVDTRESGHVAGITECIRDLENTGVLRDRQLFSIAARLWLRRSLVLHPRPGAR